MSSSSARKAARSVLSSRTAGRAGRHRAAGAHLPGIRARRRFACPPPRRHGAWPCDRRPKIVERMGGEVSLQSAAERGSVFGVFRRAAFGRGRRTGFYPRRSFRPRYSRRLAIPSHRPGAGAQAFRLGRERHARCRDRGRGKRFFPERDWSQVFVDRAFGAEAAVSLARSAKTQGRQLFVLLSPAERHELSKLRGAGFDGYLVKPLRAGFARGAARGGPKSSRSRSSLRTPKARFRASAHSRS